MQKKCLFQKGRLPLKIAKGIVKVPRRVNQHWLKIVLFPHGSMDSLGAGADLPSPGSDRKLGGGVRVEIPRPQAGLSPHVDCLSGSLAVAPPLKEQGHFLICICSKQQS